MNKILNIPDKIVPELVEILNIPEGADVEVEICKFIQNLISGVVANHRAGKLLQQINSSTITDSLDMITLSSTHTGEEK